VPSCSAALAAKVRNVRRTIGILAAALFVSAVAAQPAAAIKVRSFQSPTGNIGCVIALSGSGSEARCDVAQHTWTAPPKPSSCDLDWGNGLVVGDHRKAQFVCAGDTTLNQGRKLGYGKAIRLGKFRCASSQSGMRCVNRRSGHGFKVSRTLAHRF
jgi:hypothetical protein